MLTNTEMREVMDSQQFLGACAVMFVLDLQELLQNQQVLTKKKLSLTVALRMRVSYLQIVNKAQSTFKKKQTKLQKYLRTKKASQ